MLSFKEYNNINNFPFDNEDNINILDTEDSFFNYLQEIQSMLPPLEFQLPPFIHNPVPPPFIHNPVPPPLIYQPPLKYYPVPPLLKMPPPIKSKKDTTLVHKRTPRQPVPEDKKDEKYYEYRRKNNERARISREKARKLRIKVEKKVKLNLDKLNKDNKELINEKKTLEIQFKHLKMQLLQKLNN